MPVLSIRPDATAGVDTQISDATPTTNYGTDDAMQVGTNAISSPYNIRSLIKFDVSDVPSGATITSATLHLTVSTGILVATGAFTANRITQTGWTESATWNTYNGTNAWSSAGGDFTATNNATDTLQSAGDLEFDVTALVTDAIANRSGILHLLIKGPEDGTTQFVECYTSDTSDASLRPLLTIAYTLAAGSYPVIERIAQQIVTRLETITTANGYSWTADVERPKRMPDVSPADKVVYLVQGEREANPDFTVERGAYLLTAYDQTFGIALFAVNSEDSATPIEQTVNIREADVMLAITTPEDPEEDWVDFDGLAHDAEFMAPLDYPRDGQHSGLVLMLRVTYRHPENDPYTVG